MLYIFLAAGRGSRLHPLTLKHPKTLYKLDPGTTVLERMVQLIKKNDQFAEIIVVTGFMANSIQSHVMNDVVFVNNPFYAVTNSIASLWFARHFLQGDNVTIINGDIVMEEKLIQDIICKPVQRPTILLDSSIKTDGDYNVQIHGDRVLVMSKDLNAYHGEYAGIVKLDAPAIIALKREIEKMISEEMYDQWYENALVQMIFQNDFALYYEDISNYNWTEIDCVSDFLKAKKIHQSSNKT